MILTETNVAFPLSSVKPLDGLRAYRQFCIETTKKALANGAIAREKSPVSGLPLVTAGSIEGLGYGRCPETGSLFLNTLPEASVWASVLSDVSKRRQSPDGFHAGVAGSRTENVYMPKLDWIQSTVQIQGAENPTLIEVSGPSSRFTSLLKSSGSFREVQPLNEMDLILGKAPSSAPAQAGVMLESLDHVNDPAQLLKAVRERLAPNGLLFVTSLVASGFDMALLGFENLYLCPPDRTNCFTLKGLERFLSDGGFQLIEVSTPGVLDVEIVQAHLNQKPNLALSSLERDVMMSDPDVKQAFQSFLQKAGMSSFARIVGRKK